MTEKTKKRSRRGFTLMELVVTIAVLGALVALAIPQVLGMTRQAAYAAFAQNHRTLAVAVTVHQAERGYDFPQPFKLTSGAGRVDPVGFSFINPEDFIDSPPGATFEWTIDTSVTPNVGVLTSTIPNPPPSRPAVIQTRMHQAQP